MTLTGAGAGVETCGQVDGMRGFSIGQGRSSGDRRWATRPAHCLALVAACCLIAVASAAPAASAKINRLWPVSGLSTLPTGCNGAPQTGTLYRNAEVEPHVAVNPTNRRNLIAVWQQDRWSNGGANGQVTAYSRDGGRTWRKPSPPSFSRCQGGNAANGGDYERVTDPWVSFGPTGIAYQIALTGNNLLFGRNAILVSRSLDGGATWGPAADADRQRGAAALQRQGEPHRRPNRPPLRRTRPGGGPT